MENFTKGFAIGLSIAAPVGPIGLLCIRLSITEGRLAGIFSSLGAVTADALYGLIAALGLNAVTLVLMAYRTPIQITGGAFLLFLGITTLRRKSSPLEAKSAGFAASRFRPITFYISTLALTLSNPATILSFIGVFAGLGVGINDPAPSSAILLVAGVFSGSVAWWFILSTSASWFGSRISSTEPRWINLGAGLCLLGFGSGSWDNSCTCTGGSGDEAGPSVWFPAARSLTSAKLLPRTALPLTDRQPVFSPVNASWDILKTLSDPTRLRLLALLIREELSVAELQEILGMGQSRISSQLALLRQVNLVSDRREGKKAFYSLRSNLPPKPLALLKAAADSVSDLPVLAEDRDNLDRILQKRRRVSEQYFNLIAGRLGKNHCPGRSWQAIGHLALRLTPAIDIADLGAGEGLISQLLAHRARQVWCIDNSPRMVEVGTELAQKNGLVNLTYKLGDIERVPLPDRSVDLAILSQALHHAQHPQQAVDEAFRILRPGGQVLILDLNEHAFEKARELYADVWLGFKESALHGFLKKAGFAKVEVTAVAKETTEPHFETLLASGIKSDED